MEKNSVGKKSARRNRIELRGVRWGWVQSTERLWLWSGTRGSGLVGQRKAAAAHPSAPLSTLFQIALLIGGQYGPHPHPRGVSAFRDPKHSEVLRLVCDDTKETLLPPLPRSKRSCDQIFGGNGGECGKLRIFVLNVVANTIMVKYLKKWRRIRKHPGKKYCKRVPLRYTVHHFGNRGFLTTACACVNKRWAKFFSGIQKHYY